jgi:hypothetical protein
VVAGGTSVLMVRASMLAQGQNSAAAAAARQLSVAHCPVLSQNDGSNLNPDTVAWLRSNGIDPNSLSQEDLNILSGSGTYDPSTMLDQGPLPGDFGFDPNSVSDSTNNIINNPSDNWLSDFFGGGG